jgi:hypothetical protein
MGQISIKGTFAKRLPVPVPTFHNVTFISIISIHFFQYMLHKIPVVLSPIVHKKMCQKNVATKKGSHKKCHSKNRLNNFSLLNKATILAISLQTP